MKRKIQEAEELGSWDTSSYFRVKAGEDKGTVKIPGKIYT